MDLRANRKNTLEYLKEFQKSIPQKNLYLIEKVHLILHVWI